MLTLANAKEGVPIDLLCSAQCCHSCVAGQLSPGGGPRVGYRVDGSSPQCDQHSAVPRRSGHCNRYIRMSAGHGLMWASEGSMYAYIYFMFAYIHTYILYTSAVYLA